MRKLRETRCSWVVNPGLPDERPCPYGAARDGLCGTHFRANLRREAGILGSHDVPCSLCASKPGEPCTTVQGRAMRWPHRQRQQIQYDINGWEWAAPLRPVPEETQ